MAPQRAGLKGRHMTAQGNALGFDAIIAIKRCKRATILALTRQHPKVVAQASQSAVSRFQTCVPCLFNHAFARVCAPLFIGFFATLSQMAMKYPG